VGSRTRRLLIDSGSNGTISVSPHRGLRWAEEPLPLRMAQGMNDVELSEVGRLAGGVTLGGLTFDEPVVALTGDTELIGSEVLRHFELTFDQQRRRVRLRPTGSGPVRLPSRRGTGALTTIDGDRMFVARVVAGSPAQQAGLQVGDRITLIDGVPVWERGCREDRPEVESVTFTVLRGGETFEVQVATAVLLP
jgi:membrane-associated protease RseP (regulator of RpoE activity)